MADSSTLLAQLKDTHTQKIEPSLHRMWDLMEALNNPHEHLPQIIHLSGTNGKVNVLSFLQEILQCAGKSVHTYKTRHIGSFHERINITDQQRSENISEEKLVECLTHVIEVNDNAPATFFELTTAAAILAFSKYPADFLLLTAGAGGALDPTNILNDKAATVITPVSLSPTTKLSGSISEITLEYCGIISPNVPCILGHQSSEVSVLIENYAAELKAPIYEAGKDWIVHEQQGRLIYQDNETLMDLPLPSLYGPHQINYAGIAIAISRQLENIELSEHELATGIQKADITAQLQKLGDGRLFEYLDHGSEIWLDSGTCPDDAMVLAQTMADFEERFQSPLHLVVAMDQKDDATEFLAPFNGLVEFVATIETPENDYGYSSGVLASIAREVGLNSAPQAGLSEALQTCRSVAGGFVRILICGSTDIASYTLQAHKNEKA